MTTVKIIHHSVILDGCEREGGKNPEWRAEEENKRAEGTSIWVIHSADNPLEVKSLLSSPGSGRQLLKMTTSYCGWATGDVWGRRILAIFLQSCSSILLTLDVFWTCVHVVWTLPLFTAPFLYCLDQQALFLVWVPHSTGMFKDRMYQWESMQAPCIKVASVKHFTFLRVLTQKHELSFCDSSLTCD